MTPVERTLKAMRETGRICGIVERFERHPKIQPGIRSDLFNIFDVVAMDPNVMRLVGVQICGTDFQSHVRKITKAYGYNARMWLQCGGLIELWGWRRIQKQRGNPHSKHWSPRIKTFTLQDIPEESIAIAPWMRHMIESSAPRAAEQTRLF